ncbi:hypothetical protein HZS_1470 [Henneguya salminicola]|nr:hypothetical protein HZS_1470 [Henneguya salminicola]
MLFCTLHNQKLFGLHNIHLSVTNFEEWCGYNKVAGLNKLDILSYGDYFEQFKPYPDTVHFFHLFSDISLYGYTGYGSVKTICSGRSIVILDFGKMNHYDQQRIAETLAHEIGHNFGFPDITSVDVNTNL